MLIPTAFLPRCTLFCGRRAKAAPNGAGPAARGEAERRVRPPGYVVFLANQVSHDPGKIDRRHAFPHPLHAELGRIVCPDLAVVGEHEYLSQSSAETLKEPLAEIGRLGLRGPAAALPGGPPSRQ